MSEEKMTINFNGPAPEKPVEIIVREGKANPVKEPVDYSKGGLKLGSIWVYITSIPKPENGIVTFSYEKGFIEFIEDKNDSDSNKLREQLIFNKELEAFQINNDYQFSIKELQKLFRKTSLMPSKEFTKKILKSLRNIKYKFEHEAEQSDDRKGNTEKKSKNVLLITEGEIPETLEVKCEIFKGSEIESFLSIDIEVDVVNNQPVFSFYCLELNEEVERVSRELIDEQVSRISNYVPCLEEH